MTIPSSPDSDPEKKSDSEPHAESLRDYIRDIQDFPKPGIVYRDITPLLNSPNAFQRTMDLLVRHCQPLNLDHIVAIESRGFLFASPLALKLGVPLHLVRKEGKLPWRRDRVAYDLEYGSTAVELQHDELRPKGRTMIVDDVLATGGTAAAAIDLVRRQNADVVGAAFVIELEGLSGRNAIAPLPCFSLLSL